MSIEKLLPVTAQPFPCFHYGLALYLKHKFPLAFYEHISPLLQILLQAVLCLAVCATSITAKESLLSWQRAAWRLTYRQQAHFLAVYLRKKALPYDYYSCEFYTTLLHML